MCNEETFPGLDVNVNVMINWNKIKAKTLKKLIVDSRKCDTCGG